MNNFKEKYTKLKSDLFYMVYYDIDDFVKEHKDKEFDWSKLSMEITDHKDHKTYKFGPQGSFGVPGMDKYYNKDRKIVESLEFLMNDNEEFKIWDGVKINGEERYLIGEEARVKIADYMEKQLQDG